MGDMPTVGGSPVCTLHSRLLEPMGAGVTGVERGWCPRGEHMVYEDEPQWGHEAIPLDQAVLAAGLVRVMPLRRCRQCAGDRPARVFEDGGHVCMACGLSQDPSEPEGEGEQGNPLAEDEDRYLRGDYDAEDNL